MIKKKDIKDILAKAGNMFTEEDIAFLILADSFAKEDLDAPYEMAYKRPRRIDMEKHQELMRPLAEVLLSFGIGQPIDGISKAENKADLIKLLKEVQIAKERKEIEVKDALKIEADIRVKLNDKFDMEEEEGQKRIIVVPQKHDLLCPHTHRECTYMPTKEACMKHYNLKENKV
jgi:intein/homing endonuclease